MVLDGSAETDEPIGADMARVGHSASPGPKQPGREHKLAELGPLTYCQVCGRRVCATSRPAWVPGSIEAAEAELERRLALERGAPQ